MQTRPINVALVGDSLLQKPCCYFDLIDKILELVSDLQVNIYQYASGGDTEFRMIHRQLQPVISLHPDVILIYWDSDVSDIDESSMSPAGVIETRKIFKKNLDFMMQSILNASIMMSLGGPGILGEGPILRPTSQEQFLPYKDQMLDEYQAIIRNVVAKYHNTFPSGKTAPVPYMDIRADLLGHMSHSWRKYGYYKCVVSVDGEHPNDLAARLIAKRFADAIRYFVANGYPDTSTLNPNVMSDTPVINQPRYCVAGYNDLSIGTLGDCEFQAYFFLLVLPVLILLLLWRLRVIKISARHDRNIFLYCYRRLLGYDTVPPPQALPMQLRKQWNSNYNDKIVDVESVEVVTSPIQMEATGTEARHRLHQQL